MRIRLNELRRILRELREDLDPTQDEFELGKPKIIWNNTFDKHDQQISTRVAMDDPGFSEEEEEDLVPMLVIANESAPPGWKKSVEHMKKHKDIDNPFALAWSMKKKGAKSRKKKKKQK